MKKNLPGLLLGLLLGALATWFALRSHTDAEPAKTEAAAPAAKPKENPLHVVPAKRAAIGLVLAQPTSATLAPEVSAFGRVLDPSAFVALAAEAETARTALAASTREHARLEKLFAADQNASAQSVETAAAAVARDRTALASTHARLLAGWGGKLAESADLAVITRSLEKGFTRARLDLLPGDAPAADLKTARIGPAGGTELFDAEVLGVAPLSDPQIQGQSFLVMLRDRTIPAGTALRATLPGTGETQAALIVPRSAILYHEGSAWVYVLDEEDTFERKLVTLGRSVGDGVAITSGLEDSHQIITAGAQQILSAELQAGGAPAEG